MGEKLRGSGQDSLLAVPMPRPTAEGNARVDALIARCADLRKDLGAQKLQLGLLRSLPDSRAAFAVALFELERARHGDPDARAALSEVAASLLESWHDGRAEEYARSHPVLVGLWSDAAALLARFEAQRFRLALDACWEARADVAELERRVQALGGGEARRAEFARCLYHLELARLGVQGSRAEFARRAALAHEAYLDPDVARELVGDDPGLQHLWQDLVPYLDEFFESLEEARAKSGEAAGTPTADELEETLSSEELVELPPQPSLPETRVTAPHAPGVPYDVHSAVTLRPGTRLEDLVAGDPSQSATLPPDASPATARRLRPPDARPGAVRPPPPPPPDPQVPDTLPPSTARASVGLRPPHDTLPPAPPPPPNDTLPPDVLVELAPDPTSESSVDLEVVEDFEPGPATQAFWRYTEVCLALLPPVDAPRLSARVLAAEDRKDRKKLTAWLDDVKTRFQEVPESRALQCLMRLYLAAHLKERSLFGARNEKREEGFAQALALLDRDPAAAGRAAVWFELDGPRTAEKLAEALEVAWDYLQFCHRNRLDPLAPTSPRLFLR